jgi:fucose permease
MKNQFFTSRKGQSAIEYLMTYGWMLLVVAIVGGAVITTVQNNQNECTGEIPTSLETAQQGFGVTSV